MRRAAGPLALRGSFDIALLLACITGCNDGAPARSVHPDRRYLTYPNPPAIATLGPQRTATNLALGVIVGDSAGPADSLFGKIVDVRFDGAGRIITLDGRLAKLRIYSASGELLQQLGRPGPGPEEFADPLSLAFDNQEIFVGSLDRTVKVFRLEGDRYRWARTLLVGTAPKSMCAIHGRLYVNGPGLDDASVVMVFDTRDGTRLASFGQVYRSANRLINHQLNTGKLVCDGATGTIALALSGGLGELRAFDSTGTPRWITRVGGFRPTRVIDVGSGYSVEFPEEGFHRFQSIVLAPSNVLIVQVAYLTKADATTHAHYTNLETIFLDVRTGAQLGADSTLPPLNAASAALAAGYYDDPYPRFGIWKVLKW